MLTVMIIVFVIAYAAIALEHPIGINKSASALIGAGLLWTIYALSTADHTLVGHQLNESLMGTAQIVFFLMGAMTIVEVVDEGAAPGGVASSDGIPRCKDPDDQKFLLDFLLAKKVLMVQGTGFNWPKPDHFRVVFLPTAEEIRQVAERMTDFLKDYRQ